MSTPSRRQPQGHNLPPGESFQYDSSPESTARDGMARNSDQSWQESSPATVQKSLLDHTTPDKHVLHGSTISQPARDAAIAAAPMGDSCAITHTNNDLRTVELAHILPRSTSQGMLIGFQNIWGSPKTGQSKKVNVDSRHNLLPLRADMHTSFDRGFWALLPSKEILEKIAKSGFQGKQLHEFGFEHGIHKYDFVPISDAWKGHPIIQASPRGTDTATQDAQFLDMFTLFVYPFETLSIESHVHPFYAIVNFGQKLADLTANQRKWRDLVPKKYWRDVSMVDLIYSQWISSIRKGMTEAPAREPTTEGDVNATLATAPHSPSPSNRSYNLRDRVGSSTARMGNDATESSARSKGKGDQDNDIASGNAKSGNLEKSRSNSIRSASTKGKARGHQVAAHRGTPSIASSSKTAVSAPPTAGPANKKLKLDRATGNAATDSTASMTVVHASSRASSTTGASESTRGESSSDYKGKKRKERGSSAEPSPLDVS